MSDDGPERLSSDYLDSIWPPRDREQWVKADCGLDYWVLRDSSHNAFIRLQWSAEHARCKAVGEWPGGVPGRVRRLSVKARTWAEALRKLAASLADAHRREADRLDQIGCVVD
jgi:hypothetical protein